MYLKRLELQGFKSFADKTVLEFMPGITTVIGPNGSGKSNISDSIRWVLGEQSMKSLRGSKSEDIIFAGTQSRKSLGFAEASIVIDNSDGKLPIEFGEVVVTRRIFRNGESGYFINKTPCRLKDVLELFMDTGIGKDGYSIIGQGKIDEILSNKSEDRRNIFEEAAGIVKYRARKNEAEKKLEQTKLNLLRINDILSEIEANIEPLKNQSEKAKKYLSLREELKSIEIGLFLYNIDTYKTKLEELMKDIDVINSQKTDEESRLSVLQNLKENLRNELEEVIAKIEETQNELNNKKIELESLNLEQKNIEPKLENLSKIEEELVNSKNKMLTLEKLNESFELTKQVIIKSYDKMKNTVTPKFTRALSNNISRITDGKYTNIIFNDEQGIIIELDNGNYIPVDKLSIGTIDQLYLSLRLSMLEELSKEYMPIILDESFAYYDTKRLKNILEYISEKFKNHQVIILTCTNREKEILEELNISYNLNIL